MIVHQPHVLFRIVGADEDRVRPLPHRIPLGPRVDDLAVGVDDHEVVLPEGVDAELAGVQPEAIFRELASAAVGGRARGGGVSHWHPSFSERVREARPELGSSSGLGHGNVRQLAALEDEDPVRALGEDALHRSPRPLLIPRQLAEVLRPVRDRLVGAENVLITFLARHRRNAAGHLRRAALRRRRYQHPAAKEEHGDEAESGGHEHDSAFLHTSPFGLRPSAAHGGHEDPVSRQ